MLKSPFFTITLTALTCTSFTSIADETTQTVNNTVVLSDGSAVTLPFHIEGQLTTALLSIIDSKKARRFIDHDDFKPIEIKCDGKGTGQGIGILYFQNITASPVGAYAETVNTFAVQRKGAADLPLPCLSEQASQQEKMNYLLAAQQILVAANEEKMTAAEPLDYAMYNQHLELNNSAAIRAGIEIWGYPKSQAEFNYRIDDQYVDLQVFDEPSGRAILGFTYQRQIGMQTPLLSVGDNVLPQSLLPSPELHAQLSGMLSSTSGWVQPFNGYFWVGHAKSPTAKALRKLRFDPVAVIEYVNVKGTAYPLYSK
ncbi:hypothetical protein ACFOEE_16365 [Pseudoalteromonas fenneropenaei]|uniref:Uncharacterized protein n=1 Tax=Pseudoalteromonas fenneropenaei TaxID=1737459 RepID=A0ABV7CN44_9GAMM